MRVLVSVSISNIHVLNNVNHSFRKYFSSLILGHTWEVNHINKYSFEIL